MPFPEFHRTCVQFEYILAFLLKCFKYNLAINKYSELYSTVKILKFGTPQTIAIIVLKIEKFDVTLH